MPPTPPRAAAEAPVRRGVSGNPSGRPRVSLEIRNAARRYGPACITTLATMAGLNGAKPVANPAVRVAAMRELLDRGYGKPTQMISGDTNAPLLIDFRWSDTTPVAPIQPVRQLVIDVTDDAVVKGHRSFPDCGRIKFPRLATGRRLLVSHVGD